MINFLIIYVDLKSYRQNSLPFDFKNCKLKSLKCTGVELIQGTTKQSQKFLQLSYAIELYNGLLTKLQIVKIFRIIHGCPTESLSFSETMKFNAVIFKKFPRIGDDILTGKSGIPESIFNIPSLTELDLSFQAIKSIPDEIKNLANLKKLTLEGCVLLKTISSNLCILPLSNLNIKNCPSLKTPPPEIQVMCCLADFIII